MSSTGGPRGEEEAWRAIVENYGERPEVPEAPVERPVPREAAPGPVAPEDPDAALARALGEQERFVPPPPPPIPRPAPPRLAAWIGVFGVPAVLLLLLVTPFSVPSLVGYALVAWFVGGFLYLVSQMPRGPQDPWDDGARV